MSFAMNNYGNFTNNGVMNTYANYGNAYNNQNYYQNTNSTVVNNIWQQPTVQRPPIMPIIPVMPANNCQIPQQNNSGQQFMMGMFSMLLQNVLNKNNKATVEHEVIDTNATTKDELPKEFASKEEFLGAVDSDGNGEISKQEIKDAGAKFNQQGVKNVTIEGKSYNLITANNTKKVKGSKGNDLILATDCKKVKGKKGDDFILADSCKKVKGGRGNDIIVANKVKKVKGSKGKDTIYASNAKKVKGGRGKDSITAYNCFKVRGGMGKDDIYTEGCTKVRDGWFKKA